MPTDPKPDPLEVQRWKLSRLLGPDSGLGQMLESTDGRWVKHDDHQSALAAAKAEGRRKAFAEAAEWHIEQCALADGLSGGGDAIDGLRATHTASRDHFAAKAKE